MSRSRTAPQSAGAHQSFPQSATFLLLCRDAVKRARLFFAFAVCCAFPLGPSAAQAVILTISMNKEFSGAQAPGGSAPWVTITVDDHNAQGSVDLTITGTNLTGDENIKDLWMNLNPALDPDDLLFSIPAFNANPVLSTKSRAALNNATISTGIDFDNADGGGKYDILFAFDTGNGAGTFEGGDFVKYTVSGIATLNAASFFVLAAPHGGNGVYTAAAHIQSTTGAGSGGSGHIGDEFDGILVPEPSSAMLALIGIVGLVGLGVRNRKA